MRELSICTLDPLGYPDECFMLTDSYLISEITGLGVNYSISNSRDYKFDFEPITLTINVKGKNNYNAYYYYSRLADMLSNSKSYNMVLRYRFNGLTRYCDILLKSFTKSQLTTQKVMTERITLERLSPFYEIVGLFSPGNGQPFNHVIDNRILDFPMPLYVKILDTGDNTISRIIKIIKDDQEISRVECSLKENYNLVIDSISRQIYYENSSTLKKTNAYDNVNHNSDTFLIVPPTSNVMLNDAAGTRIFVYYKKWVID